MARHDVVGLMVTTATTRPTWTATRVVVVVLAVGAFVLGYAIHTDAHDGLPTHVYTGTITMVSRPVNGSMDHTVIALDITSGSHGTGNGFSYAPGVRDETVRVGEHVTLYTVEVPGRGEEIVQIVPQ